MIERVANRGSHSQVRPGARLLMIALFILFLIAGLSILALGLRHLPQYAQLNADGMVAAHLVKQNRLLMLGALIVVVGVIGIVRFALAARLKARQGTQN